MHKEIQKIYENDLRCLTNIATALSDLTIRTDYYIQNLLEAKVALLKIGVSFNNMYSMANGVKRANEGRMLWHHLEYLSVALRNPNDCEHDNLVGRILTNDAKFLSVDIDKLIEAAKRSILTLSLSEEFSEILKAIHKKQTEAQEILSELSELKIGEIRLNIGKSSTEIEKIRSLVCKINLYIHERNEIAKKMLRNKETEQFSLKKLEKLDIKPSYESVDNEFDDLTGIQLVEGLATIREDILSLEEKEKNCRDARTLKENTGSLEARNVKLKRDNYKNICKLSDIVYMKDAAPRIDMLIKQVRTLDCKQLENRRLVVDILAQIGEIVKNFPDGIKILVDLDPWIQCRSPIYHALDNLLFQERLELLIKRETQLIENIIQFDLADLLKLISAFPDKIGTIHDFNTANVKEFTRLLTGSPVLLIDRIKQFENIFACISALLIKELNMTDISAIDSSDLLRKLQCDLKFKLQLILHLKALGQVITNLPSYEHLTFSDNEEKFVALSTSDFDFFKDYSHRNHDFLHFFMNIRLARGKLAHSVTNIEDTELSNKVISLKESNKHIENLKRGFAEWSRLISSSTASARTVEPSFPMPSASATFGYPS